MDLGLCTGIPKAFGVLVLWVISSESSDGKGRVVLQNS